MQNRGAQILEKGDCFGDQPFGYIFDYQMKSEEGLAVARQGLDSMIESLYEKPGVISNAYSVSRTKKAGTGEEDEDLAGARDGGHIIHMFELFASVDDNLAHLSDQTGDAISEMFANPRYAGGVRTALFNPPSNDKVRSAIGAFSSLPPKDLLAGSVANTASLHNKKWIKKYGDRIRPKASELVLLEVRFQPAEGQKDALTKELKEFVDRIGKSEGGVYACFLVNDWTCQRYFSMQRKTGSAEAEKAALSADQQVAAAAFTDEAEAGEVPEVPLPTPSTTFTKDALVFVLIGQHPLTIVNHLFPTRRVQELLSKASANELVYTASGWEETEAHSEAVESLADLGFNMETRKVMSGYILHPYFCQNYTGPREEEEETGSTARSEEQKAAGASVGSDKPSEKKKAYQSQLLESSHDFYTLRHHSVTNALLSFNFNKQTALTPKRGKDDDTVPVGVLSIVRKLAGTGISDADISAGHVFGQLNRLVALVNDVALLNASTDKEIEEDPVLANRIHVLLEMLAVYGAMMPREGRPTVVLLGVNELIATLRREFASLIEPTRAALSSTDGDKAQIEYMGLQELYPIGALVSSTSLGALGGAPVALRVIDSRLEPYRSLFGGRKYSFTMALEVLVSLGEDFVSASFEHIEPEWIGGRQLHNLDFQPVAAEDMSRLRTRAAALAAFSSTSAAYRSYSAGSFFPHRRVSGSSGVGAASSSVSLASPGACVVDTLLGMSLNHAPVLTIDDAGTAISATVKAYRQAIRSAPAGETRQQKTLRLRNVGLRIFGELPRALEITAWPTIVAYSLTQKSWGHVLVDELRPMPPSGLPWRQLVLPAATKEMLRATAAASLRGEHVVHCGAEADVNDEEARAAELLLRRKGRYRARDMVSAKGSGSLFLLYGPPGTGKTLTVEALACLFGRPLYSMSFAELGTSTAELEERLTDVLALAAHWGALVLLDEGDALVEKRQRGQLKINSMSAVLLRLLESFNGALFITSNRASAFDPAALSRVTLAIRYHALSSNGKETVWRNALVRLLASDFANESEGGDSGEVAARSYVDKNFDVDKLGQFDGSGRSVGAVIRLAVGLCDDRECELTQGVLDDALNVYRSFSQDLLDEGATSDWKEEPKK